MTTKANDLTQVQGLRRLKNLNIRSVGLVDHPAIEEPFTGFKRGEAPTKASARRENYQEVAMDETMKKALEELLKSALEPFATRLDAVEAKSKELAESSKSGISEVVDGLKSALEELKGKFSDLVKEVTAISEKKSVDADGMKAALEELGKKFQAEADRIAGETCKRFDAVEGRVEKLGAKSSQKKPGQDDDVEGAKGKWPSFNGGGSKDN